MKLYTSHDLTYIFNAIFIKTYLKRSYSSLFSRHFESVLKIIHLIFNFTKLIFRLCLSELWTCICLVFQANFWQCCTWKKNKLKITKPPPSQPALTFSPRAVFSLATQLVLMGEECQAPSTGANLFGVWGMIHNVGSMSCITFVFIFQSEIGLKVIVMWH